MSTLVTGGAGFIGSHTCVELLEHGYDVVIVETVGVGQSEVAVAQMVDCFAFLALAGAGDQLQGIKKGVLEMADVISINKADGANLRPAKRAARDLATAMKMVRAKDAIWTPPVLTMSALENDGISARVIDMHTIKPLDAELVVKAAKETGCIVTAEEHSVIGGLGSAVCELLSEVCPTPVLRLGVNDEFGRSGKAAEVLDYFGLNAEGVAAKAREAVRLK